VPSTCWLNFSHPPSSVIPTTARLRDQDRLR
jgi:hypothetical protein